MHNEKNEKKMTGGQKKGDTKKNTKKNMIRERAEGGPPSYRRRTPIVEDRRARFKLQSKEECP